MTALDILRAKAAELGQAQVARETGLSKTTISLILSGKYGASPAHVEERVMKIYGQEGLVECPHLKQKISPAECAEKFERARQVGGRATGNPETLRRHIACNKCEIRR